MLYLVYLKINLRPILIYFFSFLLQVKTSKRTYSRLVLVHLFSFLPQVKVIFFKLFLQMIAKIRLRNTSTGAFDYFQQKISLLVKETVARSLATQVFAVSVMKI